MLTAVGNQIKQDVGSRGICCRSGGDEFWVLLSNDQVLAPKEFVASLCESLSRLETAAGNIHLPVSVSTGVVWADSLLLTDIEALIRKADDAVYSAKESGKGRMVSVSASTIPI